MALGGTETTERVGEEHISETEGQVICNGGRREMSKPDTTGTAGGDRESKDGTDPGRKSSKGVKPGS